jgi:hypothetical protein
LSIKGLDVEDPDPNHELYATMARTMIPIQLRASVPIRGEGERPAQGQGAGARLLLPRQPLNGLPCGRRSGGQYGYTKVYVMPAGIVGWKKAGKATEKGS